MYAGGTHGGIAYRRVRPPRRVSGCPLRELLNDDEGLDTGQGVDRVDTPGVRFR